MDRKLLRQAVRGLPDGPVIEVGCGSSALPRELLEVLTGRYVGGPRRGGARRAWPAR